YWRQHARAAARALQSMPVGRPPILVAHSGAGQLLPAIRQELGRPVAAYLFVDAGVPEEGQPRHGAGEFADYLRELYARGGRYPNWTDEALREIVPGSAMHPHLLIAPRPQPFAYWKEVIPVFAGWPDAPCGYLQFSAPYDRAGARAAGRLALPPARRRALPHAGRPRRGRRRPHRAGPGDAEHTGRVTNSPTPPSPVIVRPA